MAADYLSGGRREASRLYVNQERKKLSLAIFSLWSWQTYGAQHIIGPINLILE